MLCGTMAINNITNVHCHLNAVSALPNEEIKIHLPDYNQSNDFGSLELISPIRSDNFNLIKRGFKYEVQRGLKIHEIPDAGF